MPDDQRQGLPLPGYRPQSEANLALVRANKEAEERVLRILDGLADRRGIDKRWLEHGRAMIEVGFMSVNRAVMQPERVRLPEDEAPRSVDAPGSAETSSAPAPSQTSSAP